MPFTIACPNCDAKLKATETLVGKTIKCPRCSKPVMITQPSAVSTTPRLEIPPAEEEPEERPELEEEDPEGASRARRRAGEVDQLPEVDEEVEEGEEVEEAEIDEVMPADDDEYGRPRPRPRRPGGVTKEDCQTAMFIYLLGIFTGFIGPLIVWMMKRDESKFVNHHGKEVINFCITLIIPVLALVMVGCPLVFITWGLAGFIVGPLFLAVNVYALVMMILGATKANQGLWWEFPISIRMIK